MTTSRALTDVMERRGPAVPPVLGDDFHAPEPSRVKSRVGGTFRVPAKVTGVVVKTLLIDLDDTLCATNHRHHLAVKARAMDSTSGTDSVKRGANTDAWIEYSMACADDPPIDFTIDLVRHWAASYDIHLVTGRQVVAYDLTVKWLENERVPWDGLTMRKVGNRESNANYKRNVALKLRQGGAEIAWAMDDNAGAAEAYAKIGIPTLVVDRPDKAWSGQNP